MSRNFKSFKIASLAALTVTGLTLSIAGAAQAQTVIAGFAKNGGATIYNPNNSMVDDQIAAQNNAKRAAKRLGSTPKAASTRLSTNLKTGIENLSNAKLDNIKVHRATKAPSNFGANAYAKGAKIHIAPGQAKHLPHEAWHVVKQNQGRVTGQVTNLNDAKRFSNASKTSSFAKKAKSARTLAKTHQTAKVARHANNARKVAKAAKFAKIAAAGTGVGAVAGITAGLAGVDPIEMATLKATNPAEYNRRMNALKKNPVKYMGNNIKNNTKKVAQNVGKATKTASVAVGNAGKKAGCGIGNVFKKKANKKTC